MLWLLLIVLLPLWFVGTFYLVYTGWLQISRKSTYVPFIPSDIAGIDAMISRLNLQGTEKVIDIGSGTGTIVFRLAERFRSMPITGIEIHPVLHVFALIKKYVFFRKQPITLLRFDAATLSLAQYDVVFLFMLSTFVDQVLVPKFEKELPRGAKVISYVFRMKSAHFIEEEILLDKNGWKNKIFLYRKK